VASASASAFARRGIQVPLARTQVQAHLIAVLLFPGIQRHLLDQLRQLEFADLCGPGVALNGLFGSFAASSGVFSCSSAFFSAFGVATSSFTVSMMVVAFQR
jgi:hypothetical protein